MSSFFWTKDTPATTPDKKTSLRVACLVYDSDRDRMILWGYQPSRLETWEYYSGNWHKVTTAHAPTLVGTTTFGACYDPIRQEVVLAVNKGTFETWTYNGTDWTQKSPATSPTGTITENLVWDSTNNCAIMVGGAAGPVMKTWKWNGTTWAQLTIAGTPPAFRSDFGFGFYPPGGRFILFGGNSTLNDTWELDIGALTWTHVTPATTPTASQSAFMAWDPSIGFLVMLDANTKTWLWNGTDWTDAAPSPNISPSRVWMMIAYDAVVGNTMGYGGNDSTPTFLYETWFFDGPPVASDFVPQIYRRW